MDFLDGICLDQMLQRIGYDFANFLRVKCGPRIQGVHIGGGVNGHKVHIAAASIGGVDCVQR